MPHTTQIVAHESDGSSRVGSSVFVVSVVSQSPSHPVVPMQSHVDAARAQQVRALCQLFVQDEAAPISKWVLRGTGTALEWGVFAERPSGVRVRVRDERGVRCCVVIDEQGRCFTTPAELRRHGVGESAPWSAAVRGDDGAPHGALVERGFLVAAVLLIGAALLWIATEATGTRDLVLGLAVAALGLGIGESARGARDGDASIAVTLTPATATRVREQLARTYAAARERVARAQSIVGD